jgi:hypothetical protein
VEEVVEEVEAEEVEQEVIVHLFLEEQRFL